VNLLPGAAPTAVQVPVVEPPSSCPCVVRVVSASLDQLAVVPLVITGHPTGPTFTPGVVHTVLSASITAHLAPSGWWDSLRAKLGGSANYQVTVAVINRSPVTLSNTQLSAVVGHGPTSEITSIDLGSPPGPIAAGQTWTKVVHVRLPTASFGHLNWRLTVSGEGPTRTASFDNSRHPTLLVLVLALVILDVGVLAVRRAMRRHDRRDQAVEADSGASPVIDVVAQELPVMVSTRESTADAEHERHLAGAGRR
jgi:hypothetical protein